MAKIVAFINLTLDGVMQGPASAEEDRRDGFTHGGWGAGYNAMSAAGEVMANTGALLFGRRTYEHFYSVWPKRTESPYSAFLENIPKYVASRTLREPLPWNNSILLAGEAADGAARLRQAPGKDVIIMGSEVLIQSLLRRGLVDEFALLIHPIVLGSGRRLFPDGDAPAVFELVRSKTTDTGVIAAIYRPKRG